MWGEQLAVLLVVVGALALTAVAFVVKLWPLFEQVRGLLG